MGWGGEGGPSSAAPYIGALIFLGYGFGVYYTITTIWSPYNSVRNYLGPYISPLSNSRAF